MVVCHWQHNSDGTSIWTQFREDGKAESIWRGSVAHGKARTWDRTGRILSEVNFVDGQIQ
jgi:antitoxin component YwqK of YwqJK toxin-antitoxin module